MQQHNLALNDKSHLLQICKRLSLFFVTNAGCCRRAVMRFFTIIFNACIITFNILFTLGLNRCSNMKIQFIEAKLIVFYIKVIGLHQIKPQHWMGVLTH